MGSHDVARRNPRNWGRMSLRVDISEVNAKVYAAS